MLASIVAALAPAAHSHHHLAVAVFPSLSLAGSPAESAVDDDCTQRSLGLIQLSENPIRHLDHG